MTDAERLQLLQGMVDRFAEDVASVQNGIADARTPEIARRSLGAALIYVIERMDLIPDHIEGLGVADDAAVVRLAAKTAVSYGADDPGLRRLAGEAADVAEILDDLIGPLEDYLNKLEWQAAKGKTPADVIADPDSRMQLWRELAQRIKSYKTHSLTETHGDEANVIKVLRRLIRARLASAGFTT